MIRTTLKHIKRCATSLKLLHHVAPHFPAMHEMTAEGNVTRLRLTHRAIGQIPPDHREALREGMEPWSHTLMRVREAAERRQGAVGGNR